MDMMQRQKYYWKTKDSLKYSLKVTSAVYRNFLMVFTAPREVKLT